MSTPYANSDCPTEQFELGTDAIPIGTGSAGAAIAGRLIAHFQYQDDSIDPTSTVVMFGKAGLTLENGYPLREGVEVSRAYGPAIQIWAICNKASGITLFIQEDK